MSYEYSTSSSFGMSLVDILNIKLKLENRDLRLLNKEPQQAEEIKQGPLELNQGYTPVRYKPSDRSLREPTA